MNRDNDAYSTNRGALEPFTRFVLAANSEPLPAIEVLNATRLAAYAYTMLPEDHPARPQLLPSFLTATTAHDLAVRTLAPLIAAWHAAGIEVLPFKGLALALHTYEVPAQRFYEDVDLLMRPADASRSQRVALELGWSLRWSAARSGNAYSHELMHLGSPDGKFTLDVHRLILHSYAPWQGLQRRFTEAAWEASSTASLAGTPVRLLDPRDSILMGLVLNRAWSTDAWRLKPRDYLDFRTIVERHGVEAAALHERACELRCERTLELFLERCDPYRSRLDLRPPGRRRWWWSLRVAHERRPHQLDHAANLPLIAPGVLRDLLGELPGLVRVLWLLRSQHDVRRLLAHLGLLRRPVSEPSQRRRYRVVRGVRWGLKLLRVRPDGDCLPRALAVYAKLRRLGYPAVFVSGVRKGPNGVHGHAWVELDGEVLPELDEPLGVRYEPNLRFPRDAAEVSSSAAPSPGRRR